MVLSNRLGSETWSLTKQLLYGFWNEKDHRVNVKRNNDCFVIPSFYVDNILLARNILEIGNNLKSLMKPKLGCPPFFKLKTWEMQVMYLELYY